MAGPEYMDVEKPFIDQLVGQGWEFLAGSVLDRLNEDREQILARFRAPGAPA